ncbi:hypothetical protein [Cupriavidus pauculus]|uniref:hypothetical protein n=1 Tax=Cupriavidus pauculus TaxID=82633 RepID=UPI001EE21B4C|nr:hypothetical protein [Cupriavidus pauculus]GJG96658.1 hypothetical protein CBA19C6_19235 [Cupriavidus pauculus]
MHKIVRNLWADAPSSVVEVCVLALEVVRTSASSDATDAGLLAIRANPAYLRLTRKQQHRVHQIVGRAALLVRSNWHVEMLGGRPRRAISKGPSHTYTKHARTVVG